MTRRRTIYRCGCTHDWTEGVDAPPPSADEHMATVHGLHRPREIEMRAGSRPGRRGDVAWVKSDWFCPKCGQRDMWQEVSAGADYYHGYAVECKQCGYDMCCVQQVTDNVPRGTS